MFLNTKSGRVFPFIMLLLMVFQVGAGDDPIPLAKAPQFTLSSVDRKTYQLSDFRGKLLVVNFWASWCLPCRDEFPSMNRASKTLGNQAIVWLAINVGEDREAIEAFRSDFPIDFTVLLDTDGRVSEAWRVSGMPTTYVINADGDTAYKAVGKREWDDARHLRMLRRLSDHGASAAIGRLTK